ncbi:sugar transferase [Paenibacillus mendelii]|uniref:Sugar transferase n=1 Tax=Paenibacillus mendelii TaxID=206163 RepID=A0ABV6J4R1_9BACL|nr:sugar transferase [Paenibacillus mendelii]
MRKVAHVCTSGISHKILGDKLALLQAAGYDVTFISSGDGIDSTIQDAYPFQWRTVPMNRAIKPWQDMISILRMRKLFKAERYDIVHTHTAKAGIIGRVAAWLAGVPVVIHTSHGLPFYSGQSRTAYNLYRLLEKAGAWFCDALASQNHEDISVMQRLTPWRKTYYEGNGVDLDKLESAGANAIHRLKAEDLKRAYGIREDAPMLLMAARFETVKDHALLLDALLHAKRHGRLDWVTVLAGQGPLEADIRKRIEAEGLTGDVVLIGQQSPLVPWLLMADAVTLTSEKEGIPRSLMEAMAYGKPVVATDVLGTRELVRSEEAQWQNGEDPTGILVPYRNAEKLSEALNRLMTSEGLRMKLGRAGRRRIELHFTETAVVERIASMYRETEQRVRGRFGKRLQLLLKRAVDLVVSVPAIVLLSPVIAATAILVRLKLGGPVLFKQQRPGRYGVPFHVYKFRTMTDARRADGELLPDDVRLTSFGKLLRKLSLDELPQLLNVIRGDMSLVGPRPLLMEYLPLYTDEQARRHDLRPGITGWAQVNGRNNVSWEDKFRLDVWYVDHQSLWLDLKIVALTFIKVFKREGIQQEGQATVRKFVGSREAERA